MLHTLHILKFRTLVMICITLLNALLLPLLDWSAAIAQGLGHALQGTLCTDPSPAADPFADLD
ncbi:MAG: hypothetical protein WDA70_10620 [Lysobacteraceae bacterium]|uniref:hypothetical protein n=1 Tax=Denitratimonas sp. CY0512 TaxID=3131940 RepID=UPI0030A0B621